MNINAKYFGTVSYEDTDSIHIINGLIGFESHTKYLPIPFQEEDDSMISLQCLDDETLSFILMNPFGIFPDYAPALSAQDLRELGADSAEDISYYVISVIRSARCQRIEPESQTGDSRTAGVYVPPCTRRHGS